MSELTYGKGFEETKLSGGVSYNDASMKKADSIFLQDIAQSRYFTVTLDQIRDNKGKQIRFKLPKGDWGYFLPVKSINMSMTTYDNLAVPFSVFSDMQFLQRKKITTITLTCYDTDKDIIERAVQAWEHRCFPNDMYVAYIDEIKGKLVYQSFDVKGKPTYNRSFLVIPAGNISISRSYEENNEKLVSFSVSVIGTDGASSSGKTYGEYGYGTGNDRVDVIYEKVITPRLVI